MSTPPKLLTRSLHRKMKDRRRPSMMTGETRRRTQRHKRITHPSKHYGMKWWAVKRWGGALWNQKENWKYLASTWLNRGMTVSLQPSINKISGSSTNRPDVTKMWYTIGTWWQKSESNQRLHRFREWRDVCSTLPARVQLGIRCRWDPWRRRSVTVSATLSRPDRGFQEGKSDFKKLRQVLPWGRIEIVLHVTEFLLKRYLTDYIVARLEAEVRNLRQESMTLAEDSQDLCWKYCAVDQCITKSPSRLCLWSEVHTRFVSLFDIGGPSTNAPP